MTDYLDLACKYLDVDKGSVIKHRVQGDDYTVIVDNGILGCPKYYIPISLLEKPEPINPIYDPYSYREIQALAVANNIPANQKRDVLIAALEALEEEE